MLIGPPAASAQPPVDEFGELADFLASARNTAPSMDMPTLEGFLTAIVIGPQRVLPSQWLPWVWDQENGKDEPAFDGQEQANRILSLLMRKYNSLIDTDDSASAPFTPRFGQNARFGAQQWCEGFLFAAMFDEPAWSRLMAMRPTWFTPFLRLCAADGVDVITGAGDAPTWMNAIVPSLLHIRSHWRQHPAAVPGFTGHHNGAPRTRAAPKVGRNDPCPCCSGKKFKRCCGADTKPSPLH